MATKPMSALLAKRHAPVKRFFSKVIVGTGSGCWLWSGCKNEKGYGLFRYRRQSSRAHRFAYEMVHGDIPDGLQICHRCDNPSCVYPGHLFIGSNAENHADKMRKGRQSKGEDYSFLTESDVCSIRNLFRSGLQQSEIARRFGASAATIHGIVHRRTWRHVA